MSATSPMPPPPPSFEEFAFAYDPNLYPTHNPYTLPPSAELFPEETKELFHPDETSYIHGFLENFDFLPSWDAEYPEHQLQSQVEHKHIEQQQQQHMEQQQHIEHIPHPTAPYSNPHLQTSQETSNFGRTRRSSRTTPRSNGHDIQQQVMNMSIASSSMQSTETKQQLNKVETSPASACSTGAARTKALLSTPQKRLNHIMSEQKRRNAIRDGYAQLISLLAPAGSDPGLGMPTRGRPKGSGNRGKGQTKGKSGVLFRAVEYCKWLEESVDALHDQVEKVEAAAGIHP